MVKKRFGIFQIIIFSLFLILAVLVVINKKTAFPTPVLLDGEYIRDGAGDLDAGLWSVPLVYDWDNDGRKDLLVGQRYDDGKASHGYISFYENIGTDEAPRFNGSSRLEADGRCCLDVAAEACQGSYISVVDWNNDGLHDLLVGDGRGYIHIFLNTNTNAEPKLGGDTLIEADGKAIKVGEKAAPVAEDWNGDGMKDLLVGNFDGNIKVYLNKGTDTAPLFGSSYNLKLRNGQDVKIVTRAAPRIFDWDRDGVKDILAGELEGYIYFLRNTGTNSNPIFDGYEKLLLTTGKPLLYSGKEGGHRTRLAVTDWNNDGAYDILAGGTDGKVIFFAGSHEPLYLSIRERIGLTKIGEKIIRRLKRLTGGNERERR